MEGLCVIIMLFSMSEDFHPKHCKKWYSRCLWPWGETWPRRVICFRLASHQNCIEPWVLENNLSFNKAFLCLLWQPILYLSLLLRSSFLYLFQMVTEIIEALGYFGIFWFLSLIGAGARFLLCLQDSNFHRYSCWAGETSFSPVWSDIYLSGNSEGKQKAALWCWASYARVPTPHLFNARKAGLSFSDCPVWKSTPFLSPCVLNLL